MNKEKNSFLRINIGNMLLSCLIILLLSACFSGWKSDEGTIIINLGGEGRAAWPPNNAMLAKMDYTVTLSGNGEVIKRTSKGGGTIRTTVSVGRWNVQVDASYEKKPYAEGSAFVEVKAGQNNQVSIQMSQVIIFYKEFYTANETEWNEAITAIANEESDTDLYYAINVTEDFKLPGSTENTFGDVTGINIYIRGNHKINLTSQGSIICIAAEQFVTLQDVGFVGLTNNNTALVYVTGHDASFTMAGNASLTDNTNNGSSNGGGVRVEDGAFTMNGGTISGNSGTTGAGGAVSGTFTMNGGTISGNTTFLNGGGIMVYGTFTMNGGTISGNYNSRTTGNGGGVHMSGEIFTMNGGTISGNSSGMGGGVFISGAIFNMLSGTISDNTSDSNGGGVSTGSGAFNMIGGTISGNTAGNHGGGIHAINVNMTGGSISGNTADYNGGGVYINGGAFTMNGGTISGNTARSGGGIFTYITNNMTVTINGGTISGNKASSYGGGVNTDSTFFSMNGGTISGNTTSLNGGGIYAYSINMAGGTISGNKAGTDGGGVAVSRSFLMSGGTVYGNDAGDVLSNTASAITAGTTRGAALYRINNTTTAEYGTFADPNDPASWTRNGTLVTTDKTIKVVNGVLQE